MFSFCPAEPGLGSVFRVTKTSTDKAPGQRQSRPCLGGRWQQMGEGVLVGAVGPRTTEAPCVVVQAGALTGLCRAQHLAGYPASLQVLPGALAPHPHQPLGTSSPCISKHSAESALSPALSCCTELQVGLWSGTLYCSPWTPGLGSQLALSDNVRRAGERHAGDLLSAPGFRLVEIPGRSG